MSINSNTKWMNTDERLLSKHINIAEKEGASTMCLEDVINKEWMIEQLLNRGYAISQDYPRLNINLIQ